MLDRELHRIYLIDILKEIYSNKSIAPILGFKGGTAVYFFHKLDRFSVDLDFDLLKEEHADDVYSKVLSIAEKYGEIKDKRNGKKSILISLSYKEELQNIKIEINKRVFGSKFELKNLLGLSLQVMVKEDIFANKLVALTDRVNRTNRDLYDIYFFLDQRWDINEKIIQERTKLSLEEYLDKCISHVNSVNKTHILSGIGELLNEEKKNWVKQKLINELIFKLEQKRSNK